jgi:flagellar protein FliO/FliZ
MRRTHFSLATMMLATPSLAAAMDATRPAYVPPPPAVSSGSIVQIIFSLLLVLAAIVLVAWMLKRMNLAQQGTVGNLKVVGGVAIGQRERVVLVEIDDTWLVVGVGPGQIRTLHTLPKPEIGDTIAASQAAPADRRFASLLSSVVGQRPAGRKPDAH